MRKVERKERKCVCVCVCEREREREREIGCHRQRKKVYVRESEVKI